MTLLLTSTAHDPSACEHWLYKVGSLHLISAEAISGFSSSDRSQIFCNLFLLPVEHAVEKVLDFQRIITQRTVCPVLDEMQILH